MKTSRSLLMVFLLCLIAAVPAFGAYQVGDTVAEFTLPDAYGQSVSYSDFAGMVVVINFWTST